MKRTVIKMFNNWNSLTEKCSACGSWTQVVVKDRIDYTVCEYEISCRRCKKVAAYWAYGSFDGPTTKTEVLDYWWTFAKYDFTRIMRHRT